MRHPLLLHIEKMFGRKYVKTTMRMLSILREAEEWTLVHLREACLLFASTIMKSSLYVHQNDKAHALQITLVSLSPYWESFTSILGMDISLITLTGRK